VGDCRIALCGVGPTVLRAEKAEAALKEKTLETGLESATQLAVEESKPDSDITASADYRCKVLRILVKDAVAVAYKRAVMGAYE
jgi:CO/xanthine dehydrogenase FAD-binding subunit